MRYLEYLAHETTARVAPPRTPGWLSGVRRYAYEEITEEVPAPEPARPPDTPLMEPVVASHLAADTGIGRATDRVATLAEGRAPEHRPGTSSRDFDAGGLKPAAHGKDHPPAASNGETLATKPPHSAPH